jgi:triphosphoribosyl-dephospho-CoA synthetase
MARTTITLREAVQAARKFSKTNKHVGGAFLLPLIHSAAKVLSYRDDQLAKAAKARSKKAAKATSKKPAAKQLKKAA